MAIVISEELRVKIVEALDDAIELARDDRRPATLEGLLEARRELVAEESV
jgi:hypothetical protein